MIAAALTLLVLLLVLSWPYRLNFFSLTLIEFLLWLVGLWTLVPTGEASDQAVAFALFGVSAFVAGHLLIDRLFTTVPGISMSRGRALSPAFVWAVVITASGFTAYHFSVTGLPILSDSIETDRFDVTGSGFFGIPGRMYLYGTQMAWILASADATMRGVRWVRSRPWLVASATILASSVVSGFKGQLLALAVMIFGTHAVIHCGGLRVGEFIRRFWWIPTGSTVYLFGVATLYPSYTQSGGSLTEKLIDRATAVGAEPAALVLTRRLLYPMQNVEVNDFTFFARKYTGQSIDGLYSFERLVSTSILGFSPVNSAYAPPVTIGGLAELTYAAAPMIAVAVFFAAGALLAMIDSARFHSSIGTAAAAVFALVLTTWMLKGDLAYQSLNNLAVVVMLGIVGTVGWLVAGDGQLLEDVDRVTATQRPPVDTSRSRTPQHVSADPAAVRPSPHV